MSNIEKARKEIAEYNQKNLFGDLKMHEIESIANFKMVEGSIDEQVFIDIFLPYFAGYTEIEDFPPGWDMSVWYRIAGSPSGRVNVVRNGEVLFSVPPVVNTPGMVSADLQSSSYTRSAIAIEEMKMVRPDISRNIMDTELNKRKPITYQDVHEKYIKEWGDIFFRYGYFVDDNKEIPTEDKRNNGSTLEDIVDDWE